MRMMDVQGDVLRKRVAGNRICYRKIHMVIMMSLKPTLIQLETSWVDDTSNVGDTFPTFVFRG